MSKQNKFIEALDSVMSAEQVAQMLSLGEGDTGKLPDSGVPDADDLDQDKNAARVAPEANTDKGAAAAASQASGTAATSDAPLNLDDLNADNAVILAKDGKHTIPFDNLTKARQGEQHWKGVAAEKDARIAQLEAEAATRGAAGLAPTASDENLAIAKAAVASGEVDESLFGDWSEHSLAKGVDTLVERKLDAALEQRLAPLLAQQKTQQDQQAREQLDAHDQAIYTAHPDADSIIESQELEDWIVSQPSYLQAGYRAVFDNGTAQEVIDVFSRFKEASNGTQAAPSDTARSRAQDVIRQAAPSAPTSLSDIPGGRASGSTLADRLDEMNGPQMLDSLHNLTAEQIERLMN